MNFGRPIPDEIIETAVHCPAMHKLLTLAQQGGFDSYDHMLETAIKYLAGENHRLRSQLIDSKMREAPTYLVNGEHPNAND